MIVCVAVIGLVSVHVFLYAFSAPLSHAVARLADCPIHMAILVAPRCGQRCDHVACIAHASALAIAMGPEYRKGSKNDTQVGIFRW